MLSREAQRIAAMPRTVEADYSQSWVHDYVTRPGSAMRLRPVQAEMLEKAARARGLFANVAVGHGKTLPGLLFPTVVNEPAAVYMLPAKLKQTACDELTKYYPHFDIRLCPHLVTYSELSSQRNYNPNKVWSSEEGKHVPDPEAPMNVLEYLRPRLIILDEAHRLANPKAARTRRFLRYMKDNPETMLIVMSGSLIEKSLEDFAHLIGYALRELSPVPRRWIELQSWMNCLDAGEGYLAAQPNDWACVQLIVDLFGDGTPLLSVDPQTARNKTREAFRQRLKTCEGVVLTETQSVDVPVYIHRKAALPVPYEVQAALSQVEGTWTLPNGEEITDSLALTSALSELAFGFYYFWDWSRVTNDGQPDVDWLETRAAYRRLVRQIAKLNRPGLDTEGLIKNAIVEGRLTDPLLVTAYQDWEANRVRLRSLMDRRNVPNRRVPDNPPTLAGWLSDFVLLDVCDTIGRWREPTLVWCDHNEVLQRFHGSGVLPVEAHPIPRDLTRTPHLAMSIDKFGTGQNLQDWSHNIVLSARGQGKAWEQLIGRTHRAGQTKPVHVQVYAHTPQLANALEKARDDRSVFTRQVAGSSPKLLDAEWRDVL